MSALSFTNATAVERIGLGRYACEIPEGWGQGRSIFGGISAAVMIRAMTAEVADPSRPLRSFTTHFCGPLLPGAARVEVVAEAASSRLAHTSCRLVQGPRVMAIGTGCFGKARAMDADFAQGAPPPGLPPERGVMIPEHAARPEFTNNVELLWAGGQIPMSGSSEAELHFWVRFREPEPLDAALAVALTDAPPPAFFSRLRRPRPVATVTFTAHILAELPLQAQDNPYLLGTRRSFITHQGYSSEVQTLWGPDGRRLVEGNQVVALIA